MMRRIEAGANHSLPFKSFGRKVRMRNMRDLRRHRVTRCAYLLASICTVLGPILPAHASPRPKRVINWNQGLPEGKKQALTDSQLKEIMAKRAKEAIRPDVQPLSESEMKSLRGRGSYRNKYLAGTMPWHRSLRDVNLCTGNLFKSFTDIQVAPARGAGLALQRTYNSQEERIGPFGIGWTHAYDIRMQDESSAAITDETVNLADRADFFAGEHKYHRDADGLYTPPTYLFDELSSEYDAFLVNGPIKVLGDNEIGKDGTVKHFIAAITPSVAGGERLCNYIDDRFGNRTNLVYNSVAWPDGTAHRLLSTVTDPSNRTLTFTWTNLGTTQQPAYRITSVAGPLYTVAYAYYTNANDTVSYQNLQSVTLDSGGLARTTTFTYTSYTGANGTENGLLSTIADPLNHQVSYSYSYPSSNPTGTVWCTQVNEPGSAGSQIWTITPSVVGGSIPVAVNVSSNRGLGCGLAIDGMLRKRWMSVGGVYMHMTDYDSAANLTWSRAGGGYVPYGGYYQSAPGIEQYMTYGPHGDMLTSSPYSNGSQATVMTYYNGSQYFQKESVTDPLNRTTKFGVGSKYDGNPGNRGNVVWVQDARFGTTGKQYSYEYNAYGQKTKETNLNDVVTEYTYGDTWGNLTQVIQDPGTGSHLNRTTQMTYSSGGQVTQSTDPMARTNSFSFNALGQATSANFPSTANTPAETVSYTYDSNGRMSTVADNRGTTSLAYIDGTDILNSVTDPVTGAVSYTYTASGERATMILPGNNTWTYGYSVHSGSMGLVMPKDDPNSVGKMLSTITDDNNRLVEYWLDETGRQHDAICNMTFSGSTLTNYQFSHNAFDSAHGWLTQIKNEYWTLGMGGQWTGVTLTKNDYTTNNAGIRTANQISDANGVVRTETYGYDELYRLTSVDYGDSHTQSYTFDPMGNRATKVNDGTSEAYTYNAANMLLTRGTNTYTNDLAGNTLTGGGRTNTWDSQNRLAQCANGSMTSNFTYASDGLRHRTVVGSNTTDYILDASMFVREKLNGTVSATYLVGPRGPEYRRDDSTGAVRWYCYDGLGSVLGEVNSSGTLTATRSYDIYGSVRSSAGTSTSKHKFVGSLGHPSEDDTGLIYMRARYLDTAAGRFVSEDRAQEGENWFAYCRNSPTNYIDATGNSPWTLLLALLNMAGLVAGTLIGYAIMAFIMEATHPGYHSRNQLAAGLLAVASGVLGRVSGLIASPDEWAGCSIKTFAFMLRLELAQQGLMPLARAAGIGFIVGLLIGAATAIVEYYASSYYQNS